MQAFSVPVLPAHPRIRQRTALVASAEPLGGASETKPEAAIAAIRAKGSPSTTAAPDATNLSASARAAKQMDEPLSSAAQSTLRDEETSGGAAVPVGEQEESAAQPQAALTAPAIAAAGTSRAGSASRQRVQGASSSVEEHKAPTGAFETRRGANSVTRYRLVRGRGLPTRRPTSRTEHRTPPATIRMLR